MKQNQSVEHRLELLPPMQPYRLQVYDLHHLQLKKKTVSYSVWWDMSPSKMSMLNLACFSFFRERMNLFKCALKKKKRKAIYLWDDWLIHAVNGPVSKVMVTALPVSRFKTGFWGCREICINIGITECLLFKIIFLLPRNVLNVDNQAVSEN